MHLVLVLLTACGSPSPPAPEAMPPEDAPTVPADTPPAPDDAEPSVASPATVRVEDVRVEQGAGPFELIVGDGWMVPVPSPHERVDRDGVVYGARLTGAADLPVLDGNLEPLTAGMEIVLHEDATAAEVARDRARKAASTHGERLDDVQSRERPDPDGSPAVDLLLRFRHRGDTQNHLSTFTHRFLQVGDDVVEAAAWLIGGDDDAGRFIDGCGVGRFVVAHPQRLARTREGVDEGHLATLHSTSGLRPLARAIADGWRANKLTSEGEHDEAIPTFRASLAVCDDMAFAHNGLAWALAHAEEPDLDAALVHARRAHELTDEQDQSVIDTLQTVHRMRGDQAEVDALETAYVDAVNRRRAALGMEPLDEDAAPPPDEGAGAGAAEAGAGQNEGADGG